MAIFGQDGHLWSRWPSLAKMAMFGQDEQLWPGWAYRQRGERGALSRVAGCANYKCAFKVFTRFARVKNSVYAHCARECVCLGGLIIYRPDARPCAARKTRAHATKKALE